MALTSTLIGFEKVSTHRQVSEHPVLLGEILVSIRFESRPMELALSIHTETVEQATSLAVAAEQAVAYRVEAEDSALPAYREALRLMEATRAAMLRLPEADDHACYAPSEANIATLRETVRLMEQGERELAVAL